MDSVMQQSQSPVAPTKSRLARTFAKVLNIQSLKPQEKTKKDHIKKTEIRSFEEDEEEERFKERAIEEAFLAEIFASISAVKAAYAQMQFSQSPYNADGIQSSDNAIVSELMNLSELKQCYLKTQLDETSPEKALLLSEIKEHRSRIKMYEIAGKKLDFQIKLKESEITFLEEKLGEVNQENKLFEKKARMSGLIAVPDSIQFSELKPTHFITFSRQVVKSIRSFVQLLISQMDLADWNLELAANAIEPGISFWKANHRCFAFESYVCKRMFEGFNNPNFSPDEESKQNQQRFFAAFVDMKSTSPVNYIKRKPKSPFALFCREKYLSLLHPKMEKSIFGNMDQRGLVSGGGVPETSFFAAFCEMAKRVWLLHCLAMSFDPEVTVFQVGRGDRFSEVYMESLSDEAFLQCDDNEGNYPRVAFTVVPGFKVDKIAVQAQVYLY